MRIPQVRLARHVLDGRSYAVIDHPPTLVELATAGDAIHLLDSTPAVRDLGILRPLAERLRYLTVTDAGVDDISGLSRLSNLIELDLWPSYAARGRVAIADFPQLTVLAAPRRLVSRITQEHPLRGLLLEGAGEIRTSELALLTELRSLRLSRMIPPGWVPAKLASLSMHGVRWPTNLTKVRGIESLKRLELSGISALPSLSPFSDAHSLQELVVEDCADMESMGDYVLPSGCTLRLLGRTPLRSWYSD